MTGHIADAIYNNANHVAESATAFMLVCFSHCISLSTTPAMIVEVVSTMQIISLLLASGASLFTIYKIKKELEDGNR